MFKTQYITHHKVLQKTKVKKMSEKVSLLTRHHVLPSDGTSFGNGYGQGSAWSAFLGLATTMMGACILTLPGTIEAVGVFPGILLFTICAGIAYQSFEIICTCCETTGEYSYEALSSRLFGPTGTWIVRILTVILLFGSVIMYMVIAMDLFEPFLANIISRNTIGLFFTIIAIPLCLPDTIHELRYANMLVLFCILYIVVALAIRTKQGNPDLVEASTNNNNEFNSEVAAISYVIPIISLSYACQLNVPRAYREMYHKKEMRSVHRALVFFGLFFYCTFAVLGYVCFHGKPPSDILTGFSRDDTLINGARLCLGTSMILKTPMTFQPLRQVIELCALNDDHRNIPFRATTTTIFMLLAHVISVSAKDLGLVMSYLGAVSGNLLSIAAPGLFLWEISRGYMYEQRSKYLRRIAIVMAATGFGFSIASVTYLLFTSFV
jgi:amino acid permease